jgi:membrane-associated phospholipid phosphatase
MLSDHRRAPELSMPIVPGGRAKTAVIVVGASATLLAMLTVAVLADPGPLAGDLWLVRRAQQLGRPVPALASIVRVTTSTEACLVAAVPAAVWLARRHGRAVAPALAIALVWMLAVQPLSKELVDRPRPSEEQVDVRADYSSTSYPSGHSLSTTTTWGAASAYAWSRRRRRLAVVLALPVVCTAGSSTVQGVHWPSDALAGTIIGGVAAWLIVRSLQSSA